MLGLGSQSQLGIGIAIRLENKFSQGASRVYNDLQRLKQQSNALIDQSLRDYRNRQATIAASAGAITLGMYRMAKGASEFGHKINQVDIVAGGKLGKSKKALGEWAQGLSNEFALDPKEVSSAMFENAKAGVTKGMENITKYQLAAARATDENAPMVAEAIVTGLNAFGLELETNAARISNAYVATANATVTSIGSIYETVKQAGFTFTQFNIPLEESLALIGKLGQSGITGSQAGTFLKNMVMYTGIAANDPTAKQNKGWSKLGLNPNQIAQMTDQGKFLDVIKMFEQALLPMTASNRASALKDLMNIRGMQGMLGSLGFNLSTGERVSGAKTIESILQEINQGIKQNIAIDQAKKMMDDPYGNFQKLEIAYKNMIIKFVGGMAPMLIKVLRGFTWLIDHVISPLASSPIGSILGMIVMVGAPVVTLLFGFRAALLTATIALRGFGALRGAPGFSQMMALGLGSPRGNIPMQFAAMGMGWPGVNSSIATNSAGRNYVPGGSRGFSFYNGAYTPNMRAGNMLPQNFNPALARPAGWGVMAPNALNAAALGSSGGNLGRIIVSQNARNTGLLSRISGGMLNMGGLLGRLLPVVGIVAAGWMIVDGIRSLYNQNAAEKQERLNREREQALKDKEFQDAMNLNLVRYWGNNPNATAAQAGSGWYTGAQQSAQKNQVNVFVDGEKKFNILMEELANSFRKTTNVNIE